MSIPMPHPPGQFVEASQDGIDYRAWVPAALPPSIAFDASLAAALADAAIALGELAGTGRNLANPHLLLQPFLRREAVLSSRIEGTQATIADLYAYEAQLPLPGMAAPVEEPHVGDVREVLNYVDALNRGLDIIHDYPVSLSLIEELHLHLMSGVRGRERTPGKFRETQNIIGPAGANLSTATYVPPPPLHMRDALHELEEYIRGGDDLHRLVKLALIHYQFEAIHPFSDGNGRVGRLLISLLFVYWNLLPVPLLYLSAYFEQHRHEYYERLQGVTERSEWREWILFFLRGVAEQSIDAAVRAKRLQDLRQTLQDRAFAARAPAGAVALAGRLVDQPVMTIRRAQDVLGVSYHNARRQVHRLADLGLLNHFPQPGNRELYIASEVVDAVNTDEPAR
ncbi:MAG TPA: Fic family protein [Candidatus Limnocylindrales bacterium]|nr:Fic family protein [Candidatus Limnocylindrales bacterium]